MYELFPSIHPCNGRRAGHTTFDWWFITQDKPWLPVSHRFPAYFHSSSGLVTTIGPIQTISKTCRAHAVIQRSNNLIKPLIQVCGSWKLWFHNLFPLELFASKSISRTSHCGSTIDYIHPAGIAQMDIIDSYYWIYISKFSDVISASFLFLFMYLPSIFAMTKFYKHSETSELHGSFKYKRTLLKAFDFFQKALWMQLHMTFNWKHHIFW